MRLRVQRVAGLARTTELVVCFAGDGDRRPRGLPDAALARRLERPMKAGGFRGRPGDLLLWNDSPDRGTRRILVVGLGRADEPGAVRVACARAARQALELSVGTMQVLLPAAAGAAAAEQAREAVEGIHLGAYRFDRYLTDLARRKKRLRSVEIGVAEPLAAARRSVALAAAAGQATALARDLVNEGPSRLGPAEFARRAVRLARPAGLRCRVLGPAELRRLGMGALLAVAGGSRQTPRVLHLVYRPAALRKRRDPRRVLLVGKGVTFDSGGLNLKPGDSMATMKSDMAGAAAVLATACALRAVGCRSEVHALLGLVENMPDGAAYKPGDIVETWSGKTVEIGNTDAEGRLVLCDLLAWGAATIRPAMIVDLATLTGACVVALGTRAAGLFSRGDELRDALLEAARAAGEKVWPLPLYDDYLELIRKGPADLRNVGGRWGGAITAALFLGEFVPKDVPWAHLDMAGPAFAEDDSPTGAAGGTGAGVLTLLRWLGSGAAAGRGRA